MDKQARAWLEWVVSTSQPMRRLDGSKSPIDLTSSCLIDFRNHRFLLTVQHSVKLDSNDWFLDVGYDVERGPEIYQPRGFHYIAALSRSAGDVRIIDFCYCELPRDFNSSFQERTPRMTGVERVRHVFETDLAAMPSIDQVYSFAGEIQPEQHASNVFLTELHGYSGLKYLRSENEFHIFQLPVSHPGHEYFKGCSGAPIVDMNKQVVALVCSGDEAENTIRGVSLSKLRPALDFYCNLRKDSKF